MYLRDTKKVNVSAEPVAEEVYPYDPPVYHYTYSVDDDYTGAQIYADEARDEHETHGMYEVGQHLPSMNQHIYLTVSFDTAD